MLPSCDFLPIPKCFSHLVVISGVNENEHHNQGIRLKIDFNLVPDCSSSESEEVHGPATMSNNSQSIISRSALVMPVDKKQLNYISHNDSSSSLAETSNESDDKLSCSVNDSFSDTLKPLDHNPLSVREETCDHKNPYLKLNSSLMKLQKEMKQLRSLDLSLFCQLLSLHEAIQDYKITVSDRFSETGSEYSLGSASYMGSMSSLNEESDWGDESPQGFDQHDGSDFDQNKNHHNASNLLKQIADLAQRAEEEF